MAQDSKKIIAHALCKRLSLNPENFRGDIENSDVKSLCTNILSSSQNGSSLLSNEKVMKWIAFSDRFSMDSEACPGALNDLDAELLQKSVLLGNGFKISEADVIVYSVIHPYVAAMAKADRKKFLNVLRWMDYVQNKEDLGSIVEGISVEKVQFEPPAAKGTVPAEANSNSKGAAKDNNVKKEPTKSTKSANGPEVGKASPKETAAKSKGEKAAGDTARKKPESESTAKDDVPVSLLNIQVGLIRKAWKHPSADSLLVEEIDVGESKVRQVVSGLAKFCTPENLVNRRVALITNVKPGKLRDVVSEGLVLCASNEDHSVVEPLLPPEAAQVGERISFSGHEGKPEDVLNPKKKQLEKITPHLFTDENGVATYKGIPFMTSAGPCTSSIQKGSIK